MNNKYIFSLLGLLFIIHGLQLFIPSIAQGLGETSFFVPLLSSGLSILIGSFLLFYPLFQSIGFKKVVLIFAISRSLFAFPMGLWWFFSNCLSRCDPTDILIAVWPWAFFLITIYLSIRELRGVQGETRSRSSSILGLVILIVLLLCVASYFALGWMFRDFH